MTYTRKFPELAPQILILAQTWSAILKRWGFLAWFLPKELAIAATNGPAFKFWQNIKFPCLELFTLRFFEFAEQLKTFNGKPIIIKLLEGTHGEGVILTESPQNALATIETLNAAGVKFLLQEYIEEANGADVRAIVVDGVVVAAMKRKCKIGDFRSNLHRGGTSEMISLSSAEEKIAIKAAKAMNLGFCGVDILQSKNGPLVLEINSTPGLEGIENTSGKNVSKSVIGFIERNKK